MQQRRLAAARQRNAVPDANCTAIGLIEHGAARFLAHCKNQLLSLFDLGPGLKDHTDRQIGWRYFFSGQYAVAVDRIVGTKIVVLEDSPALGLVMLTWGLTGVGGVFEFVPQVPNRL